MRPLVLLVLAEFLSIVLLGVVWLQTGSSAAAAPSTTPSATTSPATAAGALTASSVSAPTAAAAPAAASRREAAASAAQITADDPLGILVTGTVRSVDGTPVEGASVWFRRDTEYHVGQAAAGGAYAALGLRPGEWRLEGRAEGFAKYEGTCTLDADAFQRVDVELRPSYVVRVKVQGADRKSIMDALQQQTMFGLPYVVASEAPLEGDLPPTDQSRASFFGLGEWHGVYDVGRSADPKLREQGYAGELRLNRSPPVYAALLVRTTLLQTQRITPGQQELVFTLEASDVLAKLGTVRLRLLDGVTGGPLAGVSVGLGTAQGGGGRGKSDDDGRVVIERALPGLGCLELSPPDRETVFRYVLVRSGDVTDLGDLTIGAAVKISGTVVDVDGKPANGGYVQWTELDCRTFPQPLVYRRNAVVDAEGKFQLPGCGRHRYVVLAMQRDGGIGYATVDATGGAPPPVTIPLSVPSNVLLHPHLPEATGYVVTMLAPDQSPVAVTTLGSGWRPGSIRVPPGSYTVQIHDLQTHRLARSFALAVGSEPVTIDVP